MSHHIETTEELYCPAFNPKTTRKMLKRFLQNDGQTESLGASIYLSGVLSYLVAEILTSAVERAAAIKNQRMGRRKTILPEDLKIAVASDEELSFVFLQKETLFPEEPAQAWSELCGEEGALSMQKELMNSIFGKVVKTVKTVVYCLTSKC